MSAFDRIDTLFTYLVNTGPDSLPACVEYERERLEVEAERQAIANDKRFIASKALSALPDEIQGLVEVGSKTFARTWAVTLRELKLPAMKERAMAEARAAHDPLVDEERAAIAKRKETLMQAAKTTGVDGDYLAAADPEIRKHDERIREIEKVILRFPFGSAYLSQEEMRHVDDLKQQATVIAHTIAQLPIPRRAG